MIYETNAGDFWKRTKEFYEPRIGDTWCVGLTYIRNYDHISSELGLEFNNNIIGRIYPNHTIQFKVIDEHKWFLAKIKYGI
jgi:hypothetical protein